MDFHHRLYQESVQHFQTFEEEKAYDGECKAACRGTQSSV